MQRIRPYFGVISVLIIALVLTVWAVRWMGFNFHNISTVTIGDQYDSVSNQWAIYQAIDNLLHRPLNLGYSTIFYGEPSSFAYTIAPYGIAVVMLPVFALTQNITLTSNLYFIATYVLTVLVGYLLVRYLLRSSYIIALVAGLMLAFAQYRYSQNAHIESLSTEFLLFAIYALHRLIDSPRLRWALALALGFWLTLLTSGYYGIHFLFIAAIILIYHFFIRNAPFKSDLIVMLAIAAVVSMTAAAPFLAMRFSVPAIEQGQTYNATLVGSASPLAWFAGVSAIYEGQTSFGNGERTLFIGFTPLLLAVAAWRYRKREAEPVPNATQRYSVKEIIAIYSAITLIGYLMTLGPVLQLGDKIVTPLPYILLWNLPGFSITRAPSRFIVLAVIGTAILSACALTLLGKILTTRAYRGLLIVVCIALTIELIPPYRVAELRIPLYQVGSVQHTFISGKPVPTALPVYDWLAAQPAGTPVLEYPADDISTRQYMAGTTYHHQPIVNGHGSFFPAWYEAVDWNTFASASMVAVLYKFNVHYIIVHCELMSKGAAAAFAERLQAVLASPLKLYHVKTFDADEVFWLDAPTSPIDKFEFAQPAPGDGWSLPAVSPAGDTIETMTTSTSTLTIPLSSPGGSRNFMARIITPLSPEMLQSLVVTANGIPLTLTSTFNSDNSVVLTGSVPQIAGQEASDKVQLVFSIDQSKSSGLTNQKLANLAFDWIQLIKPGS